MPLTILPGIIQLARSPCFGDLHRAEHGEVDVAAANHAERGAESKNDAPGSTVTVSFAGVDQVGVFLALVRIRAHAEDAVLALQRRR